MTRFAPVILLVIVTMMLASCVQQIQPTSNPGWAIVDGLYPIVELDGEEMEPTYRLEIAPGNHELLVTYNTVRHLYHCRFVWQAKALTQYEIVAHDDAQPLTLYRWVRRNPLWSLRLDPVYPLSCEPQPT